MLKSFAPKPWLAPQPVAIIGTYDKDGKPNAMNAAWAGTWNPNHIAIALGKHATTDNLDLSPDFTVALATVETLAAADFVGIVSAKSVPDKIAKTGWDVISAPNVKAPVFTNFPMTFECRIVKRYDEGEGGFNIVAQIVNILCDEAYLAQDGKPDIEKMNLIMYDGVHQTYIQLGKKVGTAFHDGRALK